MRKLGGFRAIVLGLLSTFLLWFPARADGAGAGVGFSLRLHGGFSYLAAADANTGAKGLFDFTKYIASIDGGTTSGGYGSFHGGLDVGADVILQLSPRIGVGLGVGWLQSSRTSLLDFTRVEDRAAITNTPRLSAIPVRLGVFATWPLGGKWNFTANAGAAYYAAVKFRNYVRSDDLVGGFSTESLILAKTSRLGDIGFQGGVGLEYELAGSMFVFFEAQGRYARFKNFDTATASTTSGEPPVMGKIYLQTSTYPSQPEPLTGFLVWPTPPVAVPGVVEYREPTFDFSGFCLQFGFRVRL